MKRNRKYLSKTSYTKVNPCKINFQDKGLGTFKVLTIELRIYVVIVWADWALGNKGILDSISPIFDAKPL